MHRKRSNMTQANTRGKASALSSRRHTGKHQEARTNRRRSRRISTFAGRKGRATKTVPVPCKRENGRRKPASQREPQDKRRRRTPEATNGNPPCTTQRKPKKTNTGADKMGARHATRNDNRRRRTPEPPKWGPAMQHAAKEDGNATHHA